MKTDSLMGTEPHKRTSQNEHLRKPFPEESTILYKEDKTSFFA
jgi:hypothetical protein